MNSLCEDIYAPLYSQFKELVLCGLWRRERGLLIRRGLCDLRARSLGHFLFPFHNSAPLNRSLKSPPRHPTIAYFLRIDDIDRTSSIPRGVTAARLALRTERENDLLPDRVVEPSCASSSSDQRRPRRGGSGIVSALRRFANTVSTLRSPSEGVAVNDEAAEAVVRGDRRGVNFNPARRGGPTPRFFHRPQRSNNISIAGRPSSSVSSSVTPINNETLGRGDKASYCLSDGKIAALKNVIDHSAWCFLIFVCILILLFGPAMYAIWMPKSNDRASLVTVSVAAFALVVDMVIRCIVDKSYFSLIGCYSRDERGKRNCRPSVFHVGSFLFWFDVVRTISSTPPPHPGFTIFVLIPLPLGSLRSLSCRSYWQSRIP